MAAPIEKTTGLAAAGASSAPTTVYGQYLTTHGFWLLSYAEWIQVLGGVYVLALLVGMARRWIRQRLRK